MTTQLSVRQQVASDVFVMLGPDTAASLTLAATTSIVYTDGTSDTLAAGTTAQVVGGGVSFDRSHDVWVAFCYKGDSVLRVQKESLLYLLTADYAPLVRILEHDIVPYQPVPFGGGATIKTGSWSGGALYAVGSSWRGGAFYGVLDSHSWRGGASVSGVPFALTYPQGGSRPSSAFEFFVKVPSAPGGDMTLVDMDAGVAGYMRVKLTSSLHVYCEFALPHNSSSTIQTWDISTTALSTGVWYYVSVGNWTGNNFQFRYAGRVWAPGGVSLGGDVVQPAGYVSWDGSGDLHGITLTMTLGLGVSLSSSYLPFPDTVGWEMSKFFVGQTGFGPLSMPTSDRGGGDAFYNARQTAGATLTLTDSSGNAHNATEGAQHLAIVADGPYP